MPIEVPRVRVKKPERSRAAEQIGKTRLRHDDQPTDDKLKTSDLMVGIVAGLTLVVRRLWLSVVLPWYGDRVYQDAHFEGSWSATEAMTTTPKMSTQLS